MRIDRATSRTRACGSSAATEHPVASRTATQPSRRTTRHVLMHLGARHEPWVPDHDSSSPRQTQWWATLRATRADHIRAVRAVAEHGYRKADRAAGATKTRTGQHGPPSKAGSKAGL